MAIEQKITTGPTFTQQGVLVPKGTTITVDTSKMGEKARPAAKQGSASADNLISLKDAEKQIASTAVIAPIAPTGPNPTAPQQVPAGTVQTPEGFVSDGQLLVPEGGDAADEIEEEAPKRTAAKKAPAKK